MLKTIASTTGSSPRMRGARPPPGYTRAARRIIPADAGSTPGCRCEYCTHKDHPRGCGEHHVDQRLDPIGAGSSPRMRGAHVFNRSVATLRRIIPADAGSTFPHQSCHWPTEDHPHGCGEHSVAPLRMSCRAGSSPRMRGAPRLHGLVPRLLRIIPADAGSTATALQTA